MRPGDAVYIQVGHVPGQRQWLVATVVSIGRKLCSVDVDLVPTGTERRRIPVADLRPCGPVRLGSVAEPSREV
jgi:hypothetical protein